MSVHRDVPNIRASRWKVAVMFPTGNPRLAAALTLRL